MWILRPSGLTWLSLPFLYHFLWWACGKVSHPLSRSWLLPHYFRPNDLPAEQGVFCTNPLRRLLRCLGSLGQFELGTRFTQLCWRIFDTRKIIKSRDRARSLFIQRLVAPLLESSNLKDGRLKPTLQRRDVDQEKIHGYSHKRHLARSDFFLVGCC